MLASFLYLMGSFLLSVVICWLLVAQADRHLHLTGDRIEGPQKFHEKPVPRIGGVAIVSGLIMGAFWPIESAALIKLFLLAALPVFLAGLIEDVTKSVAPLLRLAAAMVTGGLFVLNADTVILSLGWPVLDLFLESRWLAMAVTVIAIAALANAINIIDGLNGLSMGNVMIAAAGIAWLATAAGDAALGRAALFLLVCVLGVGLYNFPAGRIFVGDGGAYLMGAVLAMLLIMLPARNPEISPVASALLVAYPLWELLRSAVRRTLASQQSALEPDAKHLHSLIFSDIQARTAAKPDRLRMLAPNPAAGLRVLLLPLLGGIWTIIFSHDRWLLLIGVVVTILLFEVIYRRSRKQQFSEA